MPHIELVEAVNDPGVPGKTGDDRYGFDGAAGTAWALDGATDVTDLRPFPTHESGAAWVAETLSGLLTTAPWPEDEPADYWRRVLKRLIDRAEDTSKIPIKDLPGEAKPIAAGVWMRLHDDGHADFAWLGDCVALLKTGGGVETLGSPEKADAETEEARRLLAMTPEARLKALQTARSLQNTDGNWIFGLDDQAADHLKTATRPLDPGAEAILMTDGFYRLISPYAAYDAAGLFDLVRAEGLSAAVRALRAMEGADADNAALGRIKTRDDACALWLRAVG
ncbi:MAG: protein phosphatase 2C domain-containing protein [Pseudomonadota bacterium]